MPNYLQNFDNHQALKIAISYLTDASHEWWIIFKDNEPRKSIRIWPDPKYTLFAIFDVLNKDKKARDKPAKWTKLREVLFF